MASGFDEFTPEGSSNTDDSPQDVLSVFDSNFFGDMDVDNLPELTDGSYPFRLAGISTFHYDADEVNNRAEQDILIWEWKIDDPENNAGVGHLHGESLQQRFNIHPKYNDKTATPEERAKVRDDVRKLKRQLEKFDIPLKGFNPRKLKDDYVDKLLAMIEVRVNYSEKNDAWYRNIRSIEPRKPGDSSGGFSGFGDL